MLVGRGWKSSAFEMPWKSEKHHIINKQTEEKRKRQTLVVVIDPGNEKSNDFACSYLIIQWKFSSPFTFLSCCLKRSCKLQNKARRKQFGCLVFSVVYLVGFNLVWLVFFGMGFWGGHRGFLFVFLVFSTPVRVNSVPTAEGTVAGTMRMVNAVSGA